MDVYQEALDYLDSHNITVEDDEVDPDVFEEDVFQEESESYLLSPVQTDCVYPETPDTPTMRTPEALLEKRLTVLWAILDSEQLYLNELEALLMPMKALRASSGTSKPVLSSQQVQTVFYQVPELRDLHRDFYAALRDRLRPEPGPRPGSGSGTESGSLQLTVGDLFLKMVSQLGVYRGFIDNYESAVEIVRRCTLADERFRTLAESMLSFNGRDKAKTKYTFEALLYKPLDRITKTTLVLHDLLKTTPEDHRDTAVLQEALRLSRGFLCGLNERSLCKREVTLSHDMWRRLMRDGFVVDVCEGERHHLRHLFLYTDLLLCVKMKGGAAGKPIQYRFCWYLPLAGLRVSWRRETERSADTHLRVHTVRTKMHLLRCELQQNTGGSKALDKCRRKLEQLELLLFTLSPVHYLELHSPSGKSHTLLLSSLYELLEWRGAIHKLTGEDVETVPPDLLTLTGSCAKLRMTQQPPLNSLQTVDEDRCLCGTLSIVVHSACGLQQPSSVYVCVELDGYEFYETQAQTHSSVSTLTPCWDQEFSFQVDGARNLRVLCVRETEVGESGEVLGKTSVQLDPSTLPRRWRRRSLSLGQVEMSVSLRYCAHPLDPPDLKSARQQPVFCVDIGAAALQEGVLVPHVVRCCVEEVERRGLEELGIYRISGAASVIETLKTAFNANLREAVAVLRRVDVNAVSGTLKLYFRTLPEPLIPTELFRSLASALDIPDVRSKIRCILSLLQNCPAVNINTFLFLLHHLRRVAEKQEVNKMPLMNLATVFGPTVLRPPVARLGQCTPAVDISQEVVVQVQVVYFCLLCDHLPAAQTSIPYETEDTM